MRLLQQSMAISLSCCMLLMGPTGGFAYQNDVTVSPPQAAQQNPDQLQQLVAPIALYPDGLIAQILPAATFPTEVVDAQRWMDQHKDLKGDALAKEVDKQPWDPSVKALTQFPAVLANMNQNLAWTSELGDVYANQQQDLTQAIQTMRQRAKQAGNLTDYSSGERDDEGSNHRHSTSSARHRVRASIRSLAGLRGSASRVPRLVPVSRIVLGWSRNRFWIGIRDRILWRLRLGLAPLGIRLARPRRRSTLQPQRLRFA